MRNRLNSVSATVSSGTFGSANGQIFSLNENRTAFYIQNLNTGLLYVAYGTSASANVCNYILASGERVDDGWGGSIRESDWVGPVAVSGQFFGAGSAPRYLAWELT